jgi:hypothetical protein
LICLAVSSPTTSEEREQPLSIQGLDWDVAQLFMSGMGYGVTHFNTTFMDGKLRLYCVTRRQRKRRAPLGSGFKTLKGPTPDFVTLLR